jgi:hypothetical protein
MAANFEISPMAIEIKAAFADGAEFRKPGSGRSLYFRSVIQIMLSLGRSA